MPEINQTVEGTGYECPNPIRDEYTEIADTDLLTIIEDFDQQGVDVFVDLTSTTADEGVIITDDMSDSAFDGALQTYARFIIDTCGISEVDGLLLIRVREDKATHVEALNNQDEYKSSHSRDFEEFVDDFHDQVRTADVKEMQNAAAKALEDYYDIQFTVTEPETDSEGQPEIAQQPKDSLDFPVLPIAGTVLGLTAAGVIAIKGANVYRRRKSTRELSDELLEIIDRHDKKLTAVYVQDMTGDDLKDNETTGEAAWILEVPDSDVPELARMRTEIADKREEWEQLQTDYLLKIASDRRGFNPNPHNIEQHRRDYERDSAEYIELASAFEAEVAEMQQRREYVESAHAELSTMITELRERLASTQNGEQINVDDSEIVYSMPSFGTELDAIDESLKVAYGQFYFEHLLNTPYAVVIEGVEKAKALEAKLDTISETHNGLMEKYTVTNDLIQTLPARILSADVIVEELKNQYHENALGTTPENLEAVQKLLNNITATYSKIDNPAEVTDIDKFDVLASEFIEIEEQIALFNTIIDDITEDYETVKDTEQSALDLAATIDETLDEAADYIEEHAVFIDDSTEKVLFDLVPHAEALFDRVEDEKPDYSTLKEELASLKEIVDQAVAQAHGEHREIIELEQFIAEAIDAHEQEWRALSNYESSHSDVDAQTERDIQDAEDDIELIERRPLTATAENRAALREQKQFLVQAMSILDDLMKDAKGDVAREERKREEAREALRQAQLAAERAERHRREAAEERRRSAARLSTTRSSGSSMRSFSSGSSMRSSSSGSSRRG